MLLKLRLAAGLVLGLGLLGPQVALGAGAGSFTSTGGMGTVRYFAAAAPLPDGRVLAAGGYNGAYLSSAAVFDPAINSFSSAGIGVMGTARYTAAAAPLPDGRVLVAGGTANGATPLTSAEIFNPATNTFSSAGIGAMGTGRIAPAAVPLSDGRTLIVGGFNGSSTSLTAEVFNPATNTFSSAGIGPMGTAREAPAAAPLPDGRVLVAGGSYFDGGNHFLSTAEVFNPATNTFSSAGIGAMGTARYAAAATPLPDGRVLVAGGYNGAYPSSAEVFDPATNTFSSAGIGAMGTGRGGPAAAPLPDGRVLVAGGYNGSTFPESAEVFALAKPPGALAFTVKRRSIVVRLEVAGTVSVSDAVANLGTAALAAKTKRKKSRPRLKPTSATGGPGETTVPLALTRPARKKLKQKGRVRLNAKIAFAPTPKVGECLTVFKQCYSSQFVSTQTATLQLKGKKKKKKK